MTAPQRNILEEICAAKREHVRLCKRERPLSSLDAEAKAAGAPRGFARALASATAAGGYGLICEIKQASPSKGLIRADFAPGPLARAYAEGGATCLSVLTDGPYFQGAPEHLAEARAAVALPVLRKDFMVDPYQIVEARAMGADCVLVILAAVDDGLARELASTAAEFGMDVLCEVHAQGELVRALSFESALIGINNRDLKTLRVDLATSEALAPDVPAGRLVVGESGLARPEDLARLGRVGVRCFLVGEALMREPDVTAATRALLAPAPVATAAAG
jgi:indole-3-glycerol phosphate synthase